MATEERDDYPQRIADCPNCGNRTPHRELAWTEAVNDDSPDQSNWFMSIVHFAECSTCGQPSLFASTNEYDFTSASLIWPQPQATIVPMEARHLAAATELLTTRGDAQGASLLVDVRGVSYVFVDRTPFDNVVIVTATLLVEPPLVDRFTPDVVERIETALNEAAWGDHHAINKVDIAPVAADGDWRDRVERTLGLGPTNQAILLPPRDRQPRADRMTFGSEEELRVYEVLRTRQEALPANDTILIAPNAAVRVCGSTICPDFLVTYRGRVGAIEVDGPGHRGKWASDRSRDQLLEDGGVTYVLRVTVEETTDPAMLDVLVDRLLGRLHG